MADDLATLEARLDQLQELRSRGVGTVEYEGRRIEYRRDAELNAAIQDLERRITRARSQRITTIHIVGSKGLTG